CVHSSLCNCVSPLLNITVFYSVSLCYCVCFRDALRRERDTVTLHTGVTDVQKDSQILWYSGSGIEDLIAQLINGATQTDINERFRDRLELDTQTGSLTIRNLNTSDSGVYRVHRVKGKLPLGQFFLNSLHPELVSKPRTRTRQQDTEVQSSSCRLLCSVENDRDVTLSWTRGKEMLNQTSSPHLNTTLSLHLDIEEQDNDTYSCVSSNPVSEESLQVNHVISVVSAKFSDVALCCLYAKLCTTFVLIFNYTWMLCAVGAQETTMRRRERDTVTLHTGVTDVQKDSVILWYFRSGVDDLIAQFIKGETETDFDERFRDRLELDTQTGSLTIRNLNTSDSGVYRVHRVKGKPVNSKLALIKTSTSISILNLFTK
uniref:Ig-like domain-containing protein n=1 Tax=Scleropages formosus TaxID=113540 RepID=A0A8C9W3Z1_SCLFO